MLPECNIFRANFRSILRISSKICETMLFTDDEVLPISSFDKDTFSSKNVKNGPLGTLVAATPEDLKDAESSE